MEWWGDRISKVTNLMMFVLKQFGKAYGFLFAALVFSVCSFVAAGQAQTDESLTTAQVEDMSNQDEIYTLNTKAHVELDFIGTDEWRSLITCEGKSAAEWLEEARLAFFDKEQGHFAEKSSCAFDLDNLKPELLLMIGINKLGEEDFKKATIYLNGAKFLAEEKGRQDIKYIVEMYFLMLEEDVLKMSQEYVGIAHKLAQLSYSEMEKFKEIIYNFYWFALGFNSDIEKNLGDPLSLYQKILMQHDGIENDSVDDYYFKVFDNVSSSGGVDNLEMEVLEELVVLSKNTRLTFWFNGSAYFLEPLIEKYIDDGLDEKAKTEVVYLLNQMTHMSRVEYRSYFDTLTSFGASIVELNDIELLYQYIQMPYMDYLRQNKLQQYINTKLAFLVLHTQQQYIHPNLVDDVRFSNIANELETVVGDMSLSDQYVFYPIVTEYAKKVKLSSRHIAKYAVECVRVLEEMRVSGREYSPDVGYTCSMHALVYQHDLGFKEHLQLYYQFALYHAKLIKKSEGAIDAVNQLARDIGLEVSEQ